MKSWLIFTPFLLIVLGAALIGTKSVKEVRKISKAPLELQEGEIDKQPPKHETNGLGMTPRGRLGMSVGGGFVLTPRGIKQGFSL